MKTREGLAEIETESDPDFIGPGRAGPSFYNRLQSLNRDITVLIVSALKPSHYMDAFGGSGVRGIRIGLETGTESFIAEKNRSSYLAILENIKNNGLSIASYNGDFIRAIREYQFDFVDLDPYGTVVPYLDETINFMKKPGYLGITATDLSALTGSSQGSLRRRYGSSVKPGLWMHENGIRNLISYVARRAAANDCSITPLLSFWKGHYYRLFVRLIRGRKGADRMLNYIGRFEMSTVSVKESDFIGPIWLGKMNSAEMLNSLTVPDYLKKRDLEILLDRLKNEDRMILFYDTRDLYSGKPVINSMESVILAIKDSLDRDVFPTHFSTTGIKTDCKRDDVMKALGMT
ncbi:MAG: tRNA (guanine-N2)-dimethyltransferase [Candidatus Thermoplasmatota archaeon]|nr:tRNA (guanine-N2)-dimethyltransferase [Candidatus Thermoplasmatota archaeon]